MTPQEKARRKRLRKYLADRADRDLREVMDTRAGRRVVWRIIDLKARVAASSFAGEETHAMAYAEGRRAVGLDLMAHAQRVAPTEYVHMLAEATEERERQKRARIAREQENGG